MKERVNITAHCESHGEFTVTLPPKRLKKAFCGRPATGFHEAVKCPRCLAYARIISQAVAAPSPSPSPAKQVCALVIGYDDEQEKACLCDAPIPGLPGLSYA